MMIAPVSGFSHSLVKDADHFSYSNIHVAVDSLGPVFGENHNAICSVDNDCLSYYCSSSKDVYKNELVVCENNLSVAWKVTIDANNDGSIDYEYLSNLPVGNDVTNATERLSNAIKDDNGNAIKDIYLAPTKYGDYATIYMPENGFAKGSEHKIVWTATDICGNTSEETNLILIKDKKKPTPVCVPLVSELITDIDGNGPLLPLVEVTAIDFMNKAYDNCTADEDLFYTFDNVAPQLTDRVVFGITVNRNVAHYFDINGALAAYPATSADEKKIENQYLNGEKGIFIWFPEKKTSSRIYNSRSIDPTSEINSIDVMVTVWDEALNWDFCFLTLNYFGCDPGYTYTDLNGNVRSVTGTKVKNAIIFADANLPEFPKSELTNQEGKYQFSNFFDGLYYSLSASFISKEMQGLDYHDLSLLQRHLSGAKLIKNPYQLIAADINGDFLVNQDDYIVLKNALEARSEIGFTTNKCVEKSIELNAFNWYNYQVVIEHYSDIGALNVDFVAIKIGDINGSHFDTGIINFDYNKTYAVDADSEVEDRSSLEEIKDQVTLTPNPFTDYTTLSFYAPQAGDYTLLITDLAGKIVSQQQFKALAGSNIQLINGEQLGASGSYICTLKSTDMIVNKRLVLVR
jgi:hypothetical protein